MADTLPELEIAILKAAYRNQEKRERVPGDKSVADLFDHEALHEVYGLPYRKKGWLKDLPDPRLEPGKDFFSMKDIGQDRYNTVKAAAVRAFAQLEARGLCKRLMNANPEWTGITLSPQGIEIARKMVLSETDPSSVLGDIL